jgi:hypothetical protein
MATSPQPPATPPASATDADALRVVLFGLPDAGKSSLLGALAEAAQSQERVLQGRLTDLSHGLTDLRSRVYDDRPRETLEEIVPYPVSFEPYGSGGRERAVFYDCDGRVANELLARGRPVPPGAAPDGSLSQAIETADALVLVIDASAPPDQIDTDFGEFVRFLRRLQESRVDRSEVGGLPVYLVLSKCDLLATPGMTREEWQARIAQREQEVEARFRDFLAGTEGEGPVFGRVDLHVTATAVRRPALAGVKPLPREPFGVAELFHDALDAAEDFRQRSRQSGRRLAWLAGTVGVLVLGMLVLAVVLAVVREPTRILAVASLLESYRAREGQTTSARLADPERKRRELAEIAANPDFPQLPAEDQAYVRQRLEEFDDYVPYKDKLEALRPPAEATTREELDKLTRQLNTELALPAKHQAEWGDTYAARLRDKLLADAKLLRAAVDRLADWYRFELIQPAIEQHNNIRENRARPFADWTTWLQGVEQLFTKAAKPPFEPAARVPGSPTLPGPRGEPLTYRPAFQFAAVQQAREEWEGYRRQLERLETLTAALGLLGGEGPQRAPLKLPENLTAEQVAERAAALEQRYPQAEQWSLGELPAFAQPQVAEAARVSYQRLLEYGQKLVLQKLDPKNEGPETRDRWKVVAGWLATAPELRPWRLLAVTLNRIARGTPTDPAAELANFLRQDDFTLMLTGGGLHVPFDVSVPDGSPQRLTPNGRLMVYRKGGREQAVGFTLERAGEPTGRVTVYRLVPEGDTTLGFVPGDAVWAVLPVTDGSGRAWNLTWSRCRSQQYRFEGLLKEPFLHVGAEPSPADSVARGIRLAFPDGAVPHVPDLLPTVDARKQE